MILLRLRKSTQRQRELYFLHMKSTGVVWVEEEGWMKPVTKCSSRNLWRASNSEVEREYKFPRGVRAHLRPGMYHVLVLMEL